MEAVQFTDAGAPLVEVNVPRTDERRLVTVLFCDPWSPASTLDALDPETFREIRASYISAMRRVVERYGGTVERSGGDAVLAIFGSSISHEDDPERAILCALQIQEVVSEVGHRLMDGLALYPTAIRVGISTGEVVNSDVVGSFPDISVCGRAINTAAWLQSSAEPGEILVSRDTAALPGNQVRYGEERDLLVEGSAASVRVFPALGMKQSAEGLWQAVHEISPPAPLVGRRREMELLAELWERAQAGDGQLASIIGEPGVGKSRLIAEFVTGAACDSGMQVVHGRCLSYGHEVSLWLIADLVRSVLSIDEGITPEAVRKRLDTYFADLLRSEDGESRLEACDVVGEVLGLPPSESIVTRADPEVRRKALIRALRRVLAAVSRSGATIIVLQDLHWIDTASGDVLAEIVADVPGLPLLMLVTQRAGWSGPWSELGWPERVTLRPLPEREAAILATSVLGKGPLSAGLECYLAERAGGNPFFVEELARSLRDSRAVREAEGSLTLVDDVAQGLPMTLTKILRARLDRLEASVRLAVQIGSVIGRTFSVRLLAEVAGDDPTDLESALRAAQQAEIIFPRIHGHIWAAGELSTASGTRPCGRQPTKPWCGSGESSCISRQPGPLSPYIRGTSTSRRSHTTTREATRRTRRPSGWSERETGLRACAQTMLQ